MPEQNIRQETLKEISVKLKQFDFQSFDPRKDKQVMVDFLTTINSRLGALLKGYE
jgi:hypothetical protein